jgi:hypothetical protein
LPLFVLLTFRQLRRATKMCDASGSCSPFIAASSHSTSRVAAARSCFRTTCEFGF